MTAMKPFSQKQPQDHAALLRLLEEEEKKFRIFLEAVPDAIVVADSAGRIALVNQATEKMFGFPREELIGAPVEVLIPERMRENHERSRTNYARQPGQRPMGAELEAIGRRKDASAFPVEIALSPLQSAAEPMVVSVVRDITERRQCEEMLKRSQQEMETRIRERTSDLAKANEDLARENAERREIEEALRLREGRYRLLLEATGVVPWEIDMVTGRTTYIGPQAEKKFGYPLKNWYEKDFWLERLHPEDKQKAERFYGMQALNPHSHEFEYRLIAADGRIVWVRDIVSVVRTPEGVPLLLRGVMVDITRQKELEETLRADREEQQKLIEKLKEAQNQLVQSEKMASIGQLAAGVAHEINNPVGFVNSNLGTLQTYVQGLLSLIAAYEQSEAAVADGAILARLRELKTTMDLAYLREDVFNLLSESQEGLTRVKKIVADLKEFSHVGKTERQFTDLHSGLDSTLNIVHNELKYKAELVKEYGDIPPVECVASQINQVFMNLLVNAAHAIDKRGVIRVRTGARDDWVYVEVSDTGCGIPSENLSKIFDPFFTTKPVGKGTGLGLSLSYGILKQHGGRIEVQSEVGKGTAFRVWLPVSQRAPEAAPAEPMTAAPQS